jgi:hypothetical protein
LTKKVPYKGGDHFLRDSAVVLVKRRVHIIPETEGETMLVGVHEEIWPWPVQQDSRPRVIGTIGAGDGYEAACEIAKAKAQRFDHFDYVGDAEFAYWWGHNDNAPELHRFVIKA